jgi:hypothetical protein
MKTIQISSAVAVALALAWAAPASAHCDTVDGPVVTAANKALDSGDVRYVLGWVSAQDEPEIRHAFDRTLEVRKQGSEAKTLADTYFHETLVRVHRAGEGAPYTGLKPAGQVEPSVAAADQALASGKVDAVAKMVSQRVDAGVREKFAAVSTRQPRDARDVNAGRAWVAAYVDYVHYVERLYDGAATDVAHHGAAAGSGAAPAAHAEALAGQGAAGHGAAAHQH